MSDFLRFIAGGSILGLLAATMLSIPSILPPAIADEEPARTMLGTMDELFPPPIDLGNLVKFDVTIEPSVATEVVNSRTVRKIGFGRTELVSIVTTPTGTYSTDGLGSPYLRYPGIRKELKRAPIGGIALLTGGNGWAVFKEIDAGSFVRVAPFNGGQLVMSNEGNCVFVGRSAYC